MTDSQLLLLIGNIWLVSGIVSVMSGLELGGWLIMIIAIITKLEEKSNA